jgi:hypothetical protein
LPDTVLEILRWGGGQVVHDLQFEQHTRTFGVSVWGWRPWSSFALVTKQRQSEEVIESPLVMPIKDGHVALKTKREPNVCGFGSVWV